MLQGSLGVFAARAKVISELRHGNGTVGIDIREGLCHKAAPALCAEGDSIAGADDFLVVRQRGKRFAVDAKVGGRWRRGGIRVHRG